MPYKNKEDQVAFYHQWYQRNGRNRANDYALKIAEYKKQHQMEVAVGQQLRSYVNSGVIERPLLCSICGREGRINAHHPDYNKPFEVVWCCSSCHKRIHSGGAFRLTTSP